MIWIIIIPASVFLLTLWRREYGLGAVIILWPAYLLRVTMAAVPTTALELSIYALAAGWIAVGMKQRSLARPRLPRNMAALIGLWVLAWILATAFSQDRQASLGAMKAWLIDPLLFGAVLLSAVNSSRQRRVIVSAVALSGAIVATAGLVQLVWWRDTLQDNRLSSFFHPVANYAAMYLGPILVLTIGALLWKLLPRWWWVAVGLMAAALTLTVSFGGYLAASIGGLFLWRRWPDKKVKRSVLVGGLIAAALGVLVLSQTPYLSEKFKTTDRSSSLVRAQIWRTSWQMIVAHPLVGVGPNAYEPIYRATVPKLYWPPLEWLVSQPHQLYLALWLETGLLGLVIWLGLIGLWLKYVWPRVRNGDAVGIATIAAMLAILAHGFVDTPYFKNDLAMLFTVVFLLPLLNIDLHSGDGVDQG